MPIPDDEHPGFLFVWASAEDQDRAEECIALPGPLERLCCSLGPHTYLFLGPDILGPAPRV
jgi:hypothetical protein